MAPDLKAVPAQAVLLALSTGISQLAIAVLFILAARASDPASLGVVATAMAVGLIFAGLTDFGSNSLWIRETARGTLCREELGRRLLSKALIGSVAALLLMAAMVAISPDTMLWTAGLLGLATLVGQSAQVPLRGAALGHIASVVVVVDRLTAVAVYTVLTIAGVPATHALIVALIAGPAASALAASSLTPRPLVPEYRRFRFTWPWKRAGHFGISTTFLSLQALDVVILASIVGAAGAGIYGAVNKWIQPVSILAGAFASASAPFVARVSHARDAWPILKRAIWMPVSAMIVAAALALCAPWLVQIILGPTYSAGAAVLQVLALAAIPSVANQSLLVALQSLGRDRAVAVVLASAVILQLALVAGLAPSTGALACAIAVLAAQVLQLVAFLILLVHELRSPRGIPSVTPDSRTVL